MAEINSGIRPRRERRTAFDWERWPRERLMGLELRRLGLTLEDSWLEEMIERVRNELRARDLRFRPHFWLSDEWFSPDGVPGVAIPFYLAHPRLMRIERSQLLEVEGGRRDECLRILRHELGHAIQDAYGLHRRRRWQRIFGKSSTPYPEAYRPDPASKAFVHHLDSWYAQSHPAEDFAETFAVWLRPRSDWRRRYAGWPALVKLEMVDELMSEIAGCAPINRSRARPDSLNRLRVTLREHYRRKRERYSVRFSRGYDSDLLRLFSTAGAAREQPSAAAFLRRHRREICDQVARWTGEYRFTVEQVLKDMTGRCRELGLRASGSESALRRDVETVLAVHATRRLLRPGEWCQL